MGEKSRTLKSVHEKEDMKELKITEQCQEFPQETKE